MTLRFAPQDFPALLQIVEAVDLAYPTELTDLTLALQQRRTCLVECARELVPFIFLNLRKRLAAELKWIFLDGRGAARSE